jgi:membrane-associated two-gene conflict system component 1 (EACC1)
MSDDLRLFLTLTPDAEVDDEAGERLARGLRADIIGLDVDSIEPVAGGRAPDGAKSADPVTIGAMVVAMSASGGVFTTVIGTLREWLDRHSGRHRISVTIDGDTIELDRASAVQQQELVDAYVRRHSVG